MQDASWAKCDGGQMSGASDGAPTCRIAFQSISLNKVEKSGIARGESKTLHISFQSGHEGVFSETWKFTTNPPLYCSASGITLHLFGIAFWPDSPFTGPSQAIAEARIKFTNDAVQALIALRSEAVVGAVEKPAWDRSLYTLRQEIIELHREGSIQTGDTNNFLHRLYKIVRGVAFASPVPTISAAEVQYRSCCSVVMDHLLKVFEMCSATRLQLGMSQLAFTPQLRRLTFFRPDKSSASMLTKHCSFN
ncbi:unnamed protein product [Hydatigera taeniaeformis]|uniref:Uncharacterized protein n=1 Tax=Hydatigena taeniaeformis TaxID=6205 RepID=A0A0R3WUC9_HYDTA|nr:unnamed protein product [Hydatigera taeniaeformis]